MPPNPPPAVELHTIVAECDVGEGVVPYRITCSCGEMNWSRNEHEAKLWHAHHAAPFLRAEVQRLNEKLDASMRRMFTPSMVADLKKALDARAYLDQRRVEVMQDARKALDKVGPPPSPDKENPLYYPLLYLLEDVAAEEREISGGAAHER